MLGRTHVAITIAFILLFLPHIAANKIIFVCVALLATLLPDIDNDASTLGKHKIFRFLQFFVKHRGFLHSLTFCILVSLAFAFFLPLFALAFFLGYSLHLFADSFTEQGITPFWPWKRVSQWHFRTGSHAETTLFIILVAVDIILLVSFIFRII